jgi:glycosyltransferase involved in cell wall biosynthesis
MLWIVSMISGINTYQTSLIEILNNLEKRGHTVALVGIQPSNKRLIHNPRVETVFIPCKYMPVLSPVIFYLAMTILLPFYIVFSRPDFIFFEPDISALASIPSLWISKLTHVKFIMDIRSTPVETFGLRGSLQRLSFNLAVIAARETFNGMTIITPSMKQEISETFGMNPAAIGVWTSGVSKALFNPEVRKSNGEELRKKLGLNGKFVVFYHGSLTATRGILESAEAMGRAKDKNPHLVLFLLGAGPIFTRIEELIKKEGLEANVIVHRPVPYVEVPNYIAMSDVCIIPLPHHPYWNSQSPLKLMEYLAMEKPIILTNIPAHKSIVDNSDCAIFIPSAKPEIIADAIQFAYENKNKLSEWGKTGRKIVTERFTWEKISEDLENYLLSIG